MLKKEKLDRINQLAKKHKEEGLTTEELAERDRLRNEYLVNFRKHFRGQLESIQFVEDLSEDELKAATDKKEDFKKEKH